MEQANEGCRTGAGGGGRGEVQTKVNFLLDLASGCIGNVTTEEAWVVGASDGKGERGLPNGRGKWGVA